MSEELEAALKQQFDAADFDGTMTAAIEGYGGELYGFLVGLAHDRALADDVFGSACERLWKALPKFRWDSTFRVWAYTIARNEFLRSTRETNRAKQRVPISQVASIQQAIDRARTSTPLHQRTDVKDRFAKVREELEPDDHMLLGLRLDRQMGWTDIARVLGSGDEAAVTREAATLRKRYERLKDRLRELVADD
ncbi:MAG: sigma-70 family RNA polymerase sigma factor [Kofleriaceae bacterium]